MGLVQFQEFFDAGLRRIHVPLMVPGDGFVEIGFEVPMLGVGRDQNAGGEYGFRPILAFHVGPHQPELRRKRLGIERHGAPVRFAGFGELLQVVVHHSQRHPTHPEFGIGGGHRLQLMLRISPILGDHGLLGGRPPLADRAWNWPGLIDLHIHAGAVGREHQDRQARIL